MSTSLSWSIGIAVVPGTSALPWYVATQVAAVSLRPSRARATSEQCSPGGTERSVRRSSVPQVRPLRVTAAWTWLRGSMVRIATGR